MFDVAIIGAGVVGTAIARELARYELRVALIESHHDVGAGTSKANTAILHTGFDAKPGSIEARLLPRGHALLEAYADEAGIPLERTGALLVAWDEEQLSRLPQIVANARANGYEHVRDVEVSELYAREPHLAPGAVGALEVPHEYIVCPWTPPLAYATQAVRAGVELRLGTRVERLERRDDHWAIGDLTARQVVNAAGLHSDEIHRLAGFDGFTVTPRKGELVVFDKLSRPLVQHVILPVPTATTKGVLVSPTVFGNVMVGPTAQDIEDKADTATTPEGLEQMVTRAHALVPRLRDYDVTATYAGLRAATEHSDYQLVAEDGYVCAGGVRSTGLSASMAIAEWVRDRIEDGGPALRERPGGLPEVRMPNIGEARPRPHAQPERIAQDPEYGRIVCFCERVSAGEIRDAARSTIPPRDLDGLRRRTRVLMGRCQGFFCGAHVPAELEEHS